jgi:hypothetical protein
MRAGKNI